MIPAYNEERFVGRAIASIHGAARALALGYEIVVADDASTDATALVAAAAGARVVAVSCRQIAATRNAGARVARGERLVFVDADTEVDARVLRAAVAALDAGAVGGGAGVRFPRGTPWWASAMAAFTVWFMRHTLLAAGCFVFCTRSAFDAAGGFDERYYGAEEWVLSNALKRHGRFVVLDEAVLTSERKVENRGFLETLALMTGFVLRGAAGLRDRRHCGFWYNR
ncbi:MAG TPA: glycosyltransferase [Usitatibacter sp.]|nr:glycosyltransferase [Usitatibacter sp.]